MYDIGLRVGGAANGDEPPVEDLVFRARLRVVGLHPRPQVGKRPAARQPTDPLNLNHARQHVTLVHRRRWSQECHARTVSRFGIARVACVRASAIGWPP